MLPLPEARVFGYGAAVDPVKTFGSASFGLRAVVASVAAHGTIAALVATAVHVVPSLRAPSPIAMIDIEQEPLPEVLPAVVPEAQAPVVAPAAAAASPTRARQELASHASAPAPHPTDTPPAPVPAVLEGPGDAVPAFAMAMPIVATGTGTGSGFAAAPNAPVAPHATGLLDVSGESALAGRLSGASPDYPREAIEARAEADVPLLILVDTEGGVVDVQVERKAGHGFDEAAVRAVRQWTFRPRQVDGQPVRVRIRWTMQFHFD